MRTIADVENSMQHRNVNQFFSQHDQRASARQMNYPTVPQFFQNRAANSSSGLNYVNPYTAAQAAPSNSPFGFENFQPGNIPTPEQLQQHASEIMRNAILRKQMQEERKYRK